VQVGVTLAGFLSAAFGAARLAVPVSDLLEDLGLAAGPSDTVALVLVTLVISYFSLVFSELAPKRLALQRPEGVSMAFAPTLDRIATLSRPVIWLLSKSTDAVVRLLGGDPAPSARPSRRRSCAAWWRRTSRSPRTSASSSTTSSPRASASCAR
jgi:putative hemolysin